MKSSNKKLEILILLLFSVAIATLFYNVIFDMLLVIKLFYVNSINDLVRLITNNPELYNIYLVRLFMSFSDMNIQALNLVSNLRLNDVIPLVFLMFVYDYNRTSWKNNILKFSLWQYFISVALKYILIFALMVMGISISANIILLLKIVSVFIIVINLSLIGSSILSIYSILSLTKGEQDVRNLQ